MSFLTHYRVADGEDRRALCGTGGWISLINIVPLVDCEVCKILMLANGIAKEQDEEA